MSADSDESRQRSSLATMFDDSDSESDDEVEQSMAAQALATTQGHEVPAYLTNTLSKALAANTLALSLTTSHQDFQKAWDFSQTSLSACRALIDRWRKNEEGNTHASSLRGEWAAESSFDEEMELMEESVNLGLMLSKVLVGLTTTIASTPGAEFHIESEYEETGDDAEEEPTLWESLDTGLETVRQIVPAADLPPLLADNPAVVEHLVLQVQPLPSVHPPYWRRDDPDPDVEAHRPSQDVDSDHRSSDQYLPHAVSSASSPTPDANDYMEPPPADADRDAGSDRLSRRSTRSRSHSAASDQTGPSSSDDSDDADMGGGALSLPIPSESTPDASSEVGAPVQGHASEQSTSEVDDEQVASPRSGDSPGTGDAGATVAVPASQLELPGMSPIRVGRTLGPDFPTAPFRTKPRGAWVGKAPDLIQLHRGVDELLASMSPPVYDVLPDHVKALVLVIALSLQHASRLRRLLDRKSPTIGPTRIDSTGPVPVQHFGETEVVEEPAPAISTKPLVSDASLPQPTTSTSTTLSAPDDASEAVLQSKVKPPSSVASELGGPRPKDIGGASRELAHPEGFGEATGPDSSESGTRDTEHPTQPIRSPLDAEPPIRDDATLVAPFMSTETPAARPTGSPTAPNVVTTSAEPARSEPVTSTRPMLGALALDVPGLWTGEPTLPSRFYDDVANLLSGLAPPLYDALPDNVKGLIFVVSLCLKHLPRFTRSFESMTEPGVPVPQQPDAGRVPVGSSTPTHQLDSSQVAPESAPAPASERVVEGLSHSGMADSPQLPGAWVDTPASTLDPYINQPAATVAITSRGPPNTLNDTPLSFEASPPAQQPSHASVRQPPSTAETGLLSPASARGPAPPFPDDVIPLNSGFASSTLPVGHALAPVHQVHEGDHHSDSAPQSPASTTPPFVESDVRENSEDPSSETRHGDDLDAGHPLLPDSPITHDLRPGASSQPAPPSDGARPQRVGVVLPPDVLERAERSTVDRTSPEGIGAPLEASPVSDDSLIDSVDQNFGATHSQLPGAWRYEPASALQFRDDICDLLVMIGSVAYNAVPSRLKAVLSTQTQV